MKVVINVCYGGFSLSDAACLRLRELGNACALKDTVYGEYYPNSKDKNTIRNATCRDIERHDPQLIRVIGELAEKANGKFAELKIVTIPDGIKYEIEEYDGYEIVAEKHRTWR